MGSRTYPSKGEIFRHAKKFLKIFLKKFLKKNFSQEKFLKKIFSGKIF